MTLVVALTLVSLGFVLGIFVTSSTWDSIFKRNLNKSGYIMVDGILYKCEKVNPIDG